MIDTAANASAQAQTGDSPSFVAGFVPWAFGPTDLIRGHLAVGGTWFTGLRGCPAQEPVLGPRVARTRGLGMNKQRKVEPSE